MVREFDIDKMRRACRAAAETLHLVGAIIKPGITTNDIDKFVHEVTLQKGGWPAPLNYRGFPKSCCTSVNDVVCHGIPDKTVLKDGDIVNVDVTTIIDGHFGDTNATFLVGNVRPNIESLVRTTQIAMMTAISVLEPGRPLNIVGKVIEGIANTHHYGIVKEFGGHGIGTRFHTAPHVVHYDCGDDSIILKPGDIFTVEPMLNQAEPQVKLEKDGWTVRTVDGGWSAQWEHTVLITETGYEILTLNPYSGAP